MNKLFHRELGLPQVAKNFIGRKFRLQYSNHAKQACIRDRYGIINKPPFTLEITLENIIEVELDQIGLIIKIVIRVNYNNEFDIVLAIIPDFDMAIVKTCWLNQISDIHLTLQKGLYTIPI